MIARRLPHVASPTASLMALIMAYKDITLPSLAPILSLAPPILISFASNPRPSSSMAHPESSPSSSILGMRTRRMRRAARGPSIPPLGADGPGLEEVPQMDAQMEQLIWAPCLPPRTKGRPGPPPLRCISKPSRSTLPHSTQVVRVAVVLVMAATRRSAWPWLLWCIVEWKK